MTTQDLTLMSALLKKMDWLEERQKLIAQNISNADTPGYQPLELKPLNFKDMLGGSASKLSLSLGMGPSAPQTGGLAPADGQNIEGAGQKKRGTPSARQKDTYETAPAGNSVVLEEQLLKMNENYTDHAFVSNLYMRNINLIKSALK